MFSQLSYIHMVFPLQLDLFLRNGEVSQKWDPFREDGTSGSWNPWKIETHTGIIRITLWWTNIAMENGYL